MIEVLVGEKFQSNIDKMWELFRDEKFEIIVLYGMGGVGKTAPARHFYSQALAEGNLWHMLKLVIIMYIN